jgi:nucleoid-associated protein
MPADEPDIADQLANEFISHLNGEEHAIPAEFPVHKPTLTRHTHIRTKTENFELKFERAALGDSDDADIYYDSENGRIIISSLPEDVIREIEKELSSRTQA